MIARSKLLVLVGLTSALLSTTTPSNAGGSGHRGLNDNGEPLRNRSGAANSGGVKTMPKTNLGGAEREFGKVLVNGAVKGINTIDGSLGGIIRAGAARGHSGCGGYC